MERVAMVVGRVGLQTRDVSVRFGGVEALRGLSIDVGLGRVEALAGPNGSGKSTFLNAVSGLVEAEGRMSVLGVNLSGLAVYRRARLGVARTFQSGYLVDDLTVAENLAVAAPIYSEENVLFASVRSSSLKEEAAFQAAWSIALSLGLEKLWFHPAGDLSLGQRKLLSLGCALAMKPRVLLLDEPLGGIDRNVARRIGNAIRGAAKADTAVLFVEHDFSAIMAYADYVYILRSGVVIEKGVPKSVFALPAVMEAFLA